MTNIALEGRRPNLTERVKLAMFNDFKALYQKGFTTDWETQQKVRREEIRIMGIDHLLTLIDELQEESHDYA